jgi:hypothetical protein
MVPRHRSDRSTPETGNRQPEPLVSGLLEEALTTEPRYHTGPPFRTEPQRTVLRRPVQDRMVAGAAAGLARYLGVDVMIVRIALAARLTGSAVGGTGHAGAAGSGSGRMEGNRPWSTGRPSG